MRNKVFTLLLLGVFPVLAIAQISLNDTKMTMEGPLNGYSYSFTTMLVNNTSAPLQLSWERTIDDMPGSWRSQICIGELCYDYPVSKGDFANTLSAGDSTVIIGYIENDATTGGTGNVTLVIYSKTDSANINETFDFQYSSWPTGIRESKELMVEVYPNPVAQSLFVKSPELADCEQLLIFDLSGKIVKKMALDAETSLSVDVSDLGIGNYLMELKGEESHYRQLIQIVR